MGELTKHLLFAWGVLPTMIFWKDRLSRVIQKMCIKSLFKMRIQKLVSVKLLICYNIHPILLKSDKTFCCIFWGVNIPYCYKTSPPPVYLINNCSSNLHKNLKETFKTSNYFENNQKFVKNVLDRHMRNHTPKFESSWLNSVI